MREMNKKYGMNVIHYGSEEKSVEKLSTGIIELNNLLGGGFPRARFSVVWGAEKTGKSTIALNLTAESQRKELIVYYIALEPFDKDRAKLLGVDLDKLIVGHFPKAEQSLDSIIDFAEKGIVDVIILDSIHALSPKREQEEKSGERKSTADDSMALLASKLSLFFRRAGDGVKRNNICVLLIGQTRTSIGIFAIEQLSGGHALKHYAKLIVHTRQGQGADAPKEKVEKTVLNEEGEEIKKKVDKQIGFDCVIKLTKVQISGCQPELTEIHLPFLFSSGFKKIEFLPKVLIEGDNKEEQTHDEPKLELRKRGRPKKK
jgi:recombination protein RecA